MIKDDYSGNNLGSPDCVKDAYADSTGTFTYVANSVKADTVMSSLKKYAPVQINIKGTGTSGSMCYHAILVTGMHIYSDKIVYTVDDPDYRTGTREFIVYSASNKNVSSISYPGMDDGGYSMTYTGWYRTFYKA